VGREILSALLADESVAAVHSLVRRPVAQSHPKLTSHTVDFASLAALPPVDEVHIALGTTIKVAGSQAAFRAVDFDAVVAVARQARAAGAKKAGIVSAMGADASSGIFYNRVKGEMESALRAAGFETLVFARPSLLVGDRASLGQPPRAGEKFFEAAMRLARPLIPANYRSVRAADVARALLAEVSSSTGTKVLLSGDLQPRR
jgi:uncharacterized protein YbjT (DUF2867 family)